MRRSLAACSGSSIQAGATGSAAGGNYDADNLFYSRRIGGSPHGYPDLKNGEYKMISFFAKYARGLMTRYIIENDAKTIDDIKGFDYEGYGFSENLSTDKELIFVR